MSTITAAAPSKYSTLNTQHMSSPFFRFKQFQVWHDKCAMKVGTDGVLLGAWSPLPSRERVRALDIGTGSGLIALMLSQRLQQSLCSFQICGIDIDENAVEQSQFNFAHSPWAEHLQAYHSTLQSWLFPIPENQSPLSDSHSPIPSYDLIVSNPPYFQSSLKNPNQARATARHTDTLTYRELLAHSTRLLSADGIIALVLPAEAEQEIVSIAEEYGLYTTHLTYVHSKPGKPIKRILIAFTPHTTHLPATQIAHFFIESDSSPRSEEYQALTSEFYL